MIKKEFKTLNEQIEILKDKNLVVADEEYAKTILLRENYFFINGYRHLFVKEGDREFLPNVRFEELYSLFLFDRTMRNIIFKYLLVIENNLKSITSYVLSRKHFKNEPRCRWNIKRFKRGTIMYLLNLNIFIKYKHIVI